MARTSACAFRGKEQDVREIGARLNVEHILEGSVRKAGNRVPPNGETPQFVKKVTAIYASLKAAVDAALAK